MGVLSQRLPHVPPQPVEPSMVSVVISQILPEILKILSLLHVSLKMVGLVQVTQAKKAHGNGSMVQNLELHSGLVITTAKPMHMKTGQVSNQTKQVMKTVHNFMRMVQAGMISRVLRPISALISSNTALLEISQLSQVIPSTSLSRLIVAHKHQLSHHRVLVAYKTHSN